MATIELSLPDRIDGEINRLVEAGEFMNRDRAVEELLTMGISAYDTEEDTGEPGMDETMFRGTVNDQQDPAMQDDADDYAF